MYRILLVEDEPAMRSGLQHNLEFEGYSITEAEDGEQALHLAAAETFDLIILDIMLPKKSGFDVCRELRAAGNQTQIIMLTAKGEEIDRVLGLELGADDYICKPFSLREFLARVKAALRRSQPAVSAGSGEITIGRLKIDFDAYQATQDGQEIQLTHREFEILKYFLQHPQQTVTRDDLLNTIWGYDAYPSTRTVDNFILRLRQKLEKNPAHPQHLLTVHGMGYKFVP